MLISGHFLEVVLTDVSGDQFLTQLNLNQTSLKSSEIPLKTEEPVIPPELGQPTAQSLREVLGGCYGRTISQGCLGIVTHGCRCVASSDQVEALVDSLDLG